MSDLPKSSESAGFSANVSVPFERVAVLVRQLTHDVRNGLNTLDLQTAFLQELVEDPEAAPEVRRIRTMITSTAKMLQSFSSSFWVAEPQLVNYSAKIFIEDFRARLGTVLPENAPEIAWEETLGPEAIAVDIEQIFRAFSEFFKNACQFHEKGRAISAHALIESGSFILELSEGKKAVTSTPETWGREPLVSTRRGGFGMGLFLARRILAAHGGSVTFRFDAGAEKLTTRLVIPVAVA